MNQMIEEFLNQNRGEIEALAHEIFDYAEIAEQEVKSSCAGCPLLGKTRIPSDKRDWRNADCNSGAVGKTGAR